MGRIAAWRAAGILLMTLCAASNMHGADRADWADDGLTVSEGLVVWLDAAAQPAARRAESLPTLKSGDPVEQWFDSSGHGRHLRQADEAARPALRYDNKLAAVRFDGLDDCLSLDGLGLAHAAQTIFIAAAPAGNAG